ncbi:hypothetical protein WJ0W_001135 [Paenibacillus melissococcoides]|uniref:Uncharacterized protein n=1 Tax=Paenibacillus melissococcoides TaxID=2912268 RepID=A0ABN8U2L3_9BACL|nr:hypothetical protein [Paenibacillus melissococcoides]CAH8243896.1 hypothetical protein WJ0W_001135 [Paenibacillus melissococcoides]CAH8704274.1 hypothetical protein HTL2_000519 [Paenibacillus melissococcoides]CAH8707046.1 hypothetical protein WDD9_001481 [Paenibacillus melissococcoides]
MPDRKQLEPGIASPEFGYQYQWWVPLGSDGTEFSAIGIWGQYIYVDQQAGVASSRRAQIRSFWKMNMRRSSPSVRLPKRHSNRMV